MSPLIVTTALSILAAGAAPAPSPPPITVAPVTVQAPLTRPEALKKSQGFVQTYAALSPTIGQFTRWHDPVCIAVFGLGEQGNVIKARMETVAKGVGLKVGRPGCNSNIEVVFTGKPQDLLDFVARRDDRVLGYHYPSQTRALKTVSRPIQAWYKTATMGGASDNASLAFMMIGGGGGGGAVAMTGSVGLSNNSSPETLDTPDNGTPNGCGGRRFTSCLSSLFENVLVVADARRTQGQPLDSLADYLAMLAFSQPRSLDGCLDFPSVIDLYAPTGCSGRAPPDGLTPADAAYLTALYAADPQEKKADLDIAQRMAKIVINANPQQGGKP